MSRAPFAVAKSEQAFGRRFTVFDSTIGARFPNAKVEAEFGSDSMPETAQNIADELNISREEADAFALQSQLRYEAARKEGFFDDEIMPIVIVNCSKKINETEYVIKYKRA